METKGIMQVIRELLADGKSSREIIDSGYAAGTVYRVQRQFRLGNQEQTEASGSLPAAPVTDATRSQESRADALTDRLQHCQEENESLQSEVRRLRIIAEWANRMRPQFYALSAELEAVKGERLRQDSKAIQLVDETKQIIQQLREIRMENINLKGYIRSRNCGWERDFALYLERRERPQTPTCNYRVVSCRLKLS